MWLHTFLCSLNITLQFGRACRSWNEEQIMLFVTKKQDIFTMLDNHHFFYIKQP